MFKRRPNFLKKNLWKKNRNQEIDPDEIFLDSKNLPDFDQSQFEGRLEKPLSRNTVIICGTFFFIILSIFIFKIFLLQVKQGKIYAEKSIANSLRQTVIFPERGVIYDRNKVLLASNIYDSKSPDFTHRSYINIPGLAHILGYVRYPAKDRSGFYYQDSYDGVDGVEKTYNNVLSGKTGLKIVETNAFGEVETESVLEPPQDGQSITLSIDSRVQEKFYNLIKKTAKDIGFGGGAGILIDTRTGEIIASVSYPEYDSNIMSDKSNSAAIRSFLNDPQKPFLDRNTDGLYTPGSIVKPFVALAALKEGVIDPKTEILSTGSISIQNPYDPKRKTVFNDWRAQGWVDMRQALAVSSDVYFYEIGGGFEGQKGLGIQNIEKYMRLFGFGGTVSNNSLLGKKGSIPSPEWKERNFPGDSWRIGDTYNTSIGQYGFQVTPMQMARAISSVANNGILLNPTIMQTSETEALSQSIRLPFTKEQFDVIRDGMRQGVIMGTAKGLNIPQISIAAKTGTAELGSSKKYVNSWVEGFLPSEKPTLAFVGLMERGPYTNSIGALYVMRGLIEWMASTTPEYIK
ncbi:MAG: hypothetical protein EXS46_02360 [Candidatus Taylorbacteria bacterium]|nr:hypothetical protein [Candidatus Taylorbacteria bacterium]